MQTRYRRGNPRRLTISKTFCGPASMLFKAKNVRIEAKKEIAWTLDGEFGGQHSRVHIENKQKALQIMVQKRDKED